MQRQPLDVERDAFELVCAVYRATEGFPIREHYGLARELRRSAVSVGSNIAEGSGRGSGADYARFVDIAVGSARELTFQVRVATELQLLTLRDSEEVTALNDRVIGQSIRLLARLRT